MQLGTYPLDLSLIWFGDENAAAAPPFLEAVGKGSRFRNAGLLLTHRACSVVLFAFLLFLLPGERDNHALGHLPFDEYLQPTMGPSASNARHQSLCRVLNRIITPCTSSRQSITLGVPLETIDVVP